MPDRELPADELLAELDRLEQESRRRTAELQAIAAEMPAVVGRRAMIRALVGDTLANPNKAEVVRRAGLKAARIPRDAARRIRYGLVPAGRQR